MRHRVREELLGVVLFVGAIWLAFFLDFVLPADLGAWGIRPRSLIGLRGIVLAPFLHGDLWHLCANTLPLLVLLGLLAGSRANSASVVAGLIVVGGGLLWLVGRPAIHIGASSLVFGLIAFLIVAGLLERRPAALLVSIVVAVLYGSTFVWGVMPAFGTNISWEGHLTGGLAGVGIAFALTRPLRNTTHVA